MKCVTILSRSKFEYANRIEKNVRIQIIGIVILFFAAAFSCVKASKENNMEKLINIFFSPGDPVLCGMAVQWQQNRHDGQQSRQSDVVEYIIVIL